MRAILESYDSELASTEYSPQLSKRLREAEDILQKTQNHNIEMEVCPNIFYNLLSHILYILFLGLNNILNKFGNQVDTHYFKFLVSTYQCEHCKDRTCKFITTYIVIAIFNNNSSIVWFLNIMHLLQFYNW